VSNAKSHIINQLRQATNELSNLNIQRSDLQSRLETVRLALQELSGLTTEAVSARKKLENLDCTDTRRWSGFNQKKVENYYEQCQTDGDGYNQDLDKLDSNLRDTEARLLTQIASIDGRISNLNSFIGNLNNQLSNISVTT
jgi:chaperonin cofactor prefoldin